MKQRILAMLGLALAFWACNQAKSGGSGCEDIAGVCAETSSRVVGSVVDPNGKAVADAQVGMYLDKTTVLKKAAASATNDTLIASQKTGSDGTFDFKSLPGGSYTVKAVKDSQGVVQAFTLAKGEEKDLKALTLVNNGIIIGKVDHGIVQQGDNPVAYISEIGQQTTLNQDGTFTFNNVPTYNSNSSVNNYTIVILDGSGKKIDSKIEGVPVVVKSGGLTQVDTTGSTTIDKPLLATILPLPQSVAQSLPALSGGTLSATLVSGKDTIPVTVPIQAGKTPEIIIPALDASKQYVVVLQGHDSTGKVLFEGKDTVDLSKQKLETLNIPYTRKLATLYIQETLKDSVYSALAKNQRLILTGPGIDSVVIMSTRTTSKVVRTDSAPVAKGIVATMQYLDADGKVRYSGFDTVDVTGSGKDTAAVVIERLSGSISLKGSFQDEQGKDLSGLSFDTAYAMVYGQNMDTLRTQLSTKATGEFTGSFSKVPAGDKWYLTVAAKTGKGERTFLLKDSLSVDAGKETAWNQNVKSNSPIPTFSIKDTTIEVLDTLAAQLNWTPKAPDSPVVALTSLNTTVAKTSGGKFFGLAVGSAKIVAAVTGLAEKDTFSVTVVAAKVVLTMKLDTSAIQTAQGTNLNITARLTRRKLTTGVTLSAPNLPLGVTVAFSPATTTVDTSAMTVTVTASAFPGTYKFGVIAKATGVSDQTDSVSLKVIRDSSTYWTSISTGYDHMCAIDTSGNAYCWGGNTYGQLGISSTSPQNRPTLVSGNLKWASISSGIYASCGITKDGVAYCWGDGAKGVLGNGGTTNASVPTAISISGGDLWSQISVGFHTTCAVTTDGRGFCWGSNNSGEIGDSTITSKTTRSQVKGSMAWKKITTMASYSNVDYGTSCGITVENGIYCWGNNSFGQLGNGNTDGTAHTLPISLLAPSKVWSDIDIGSSQYIEQLHVCAVDSIGESYCWGNNTSGQLGVGNIANQYTPNLVLNNITWAHLFTGYSATCGLSSQGAAYCWGSNSNGQDGTGTTSTAQTTPAAVSGNQTWISLGSGTNFACGIDQYNQAYCWGSGNTTAGIPASTTPSRVPEPISQ